MDITDYQSGSYDAVQAARAWGLADKAGFAFDSGKLEEALELFRQALALNPPLRIEATIHLELLDALSEWFRPVSVGQKLPEQLASARLSWMEKSLGRLRQLLQVPDPFDIAISEGWHEKNKELVFDPSTYLHADEKQTFADFINWCEGLCNDLHKIFPLT